MSSESNIRVGGGSEAIISVRGLGKAYRIYERPTDRFKQAFTWGRRTYFREFWALREVSFDVRPGEMMGILGRNGSGKSTLLQIIAGTLAPTAGEVEVRHRVSALLELGSGFDPDFTGRENVFFSGSINGLSQREIEESFDRIAAFADIGEFIERPVRMYSTGMLVRLAFAVQRFAAGKVLIIDEALAVGDEGFQRKCIASLERFRGDGGTILLVTHDTQTVVKMCHRALLLDRGKVLTAGPSKPVADLYQKLLYSSPQQCDQLREELRAVGGDPERVKLAPTEGSAELGVEATSVAPVRGYYDPEVPCPAETVYGTGDAEITDVTTVDHEGRPANVLVSGQPAEVCYRVRFSTEAVGVHFGMMLKTKEGVDVAGVSTAHMGRAIDCVEAGWAVDVRIRIVLNLAPGTYFLNAGVGCVRNGDDVFLQRRVDVAAIRVIPLDEREIYGLAFVEPEVSWTILPTGAASHV